MSDGPPPGKKWHTREDSGIRLDREGRWWHDDEPVEHPKVIEAFNRGLQPEEGRFILRFGNDWCVVQVEDAAYRVIAVDKEADGFVVRLSDRTAEPLDVNSLCVESDDALHCKVKQGRAWARFTRDAQFQIGEFLDERDGGFVLKSGSGEHRLGPRTR